MKKTISININGVIFHIEEDGYDKLKNYLNSIQSYFSSFADSKEIFSDIESRIAERFLQKLKNENKQVISLEDVEELIGAMGTVADFEAIEQAEDLLTEPLQAAPAGKAESPRPSQERPGASKESATVRPKLVRDLRRKVIGGVAAGLAHYFVIDPLWIRLGFLLLVAGFPFMDGVMNWNFEEQFGTLSGITVLIYVAMWIAFPGVANLEEDTKIKKFYRDTDRKVIGGVAAGIAAYFGLDVSVVRFLGVLSIPFFGVGVVVYFILGLITPAAKTLTEKMEMKGEPITLSNIESKIKKELNASEENGRESSLSQILLFPFRAIALLLNALGKVLKVLGPLLRWIIGLELIGIAIAAVLSLIVGLSMIFGMKNMLGEWNVPPLMIILEMPFVLITSSILLMIIPFVVILLLGVSLIARRRVVSGTVWLTLAGLWVVGIIGSAASGVMFYGNFSRRGEVIKSQSFSFNRGVFVLDQNNNRGEDSFWSARVSIVGYDGDSLRVEEKYRAKGRSIEDAKDNALHLTYNVVKRDSVVLFDEVALFKVGGKFRLQDLDVDVYVPYDRPFRMTRRFYESKFNKWEANEKYNIEQVTDKVNWKTLRWKATRDSGIVCINLPVDLQNRREEQSEEVSEDYSTEELTMDSRERGRFIKQFSAKDFEGINLGGNYAVDIRNGKEFSVSADGDEDQIDNLNVFVDNGVLKVERKAPFELAQDKSIGLVIQLPVLKTLDLSGKTQCRVAGFQQPNNMDVAVAGISIAELNVRANRLSVNVSGASKVVLKGSAQDLRADLAGVCKMDAVGMKVVTAEVDASGTSFVELANGIQKLRKSTSGLSKIETVSR